MNLREMRENFHISIRNQERTKELAKKRKKQLTLVTSTQTLKLKPTAQTFSDIVSKYSIESLLSNIEDLDILQLISYLTMVDDQVCNEYLVQNGVLKKLFEVTEKLVSQYKYQADQESALNYLLTAIGNLVDFIDFPSNSFQKILVRSIEFIEKLESFVLTNSVLFLIDVSYHKTEYGKDLSGRCLQFIFKQMHQPQFQKDCLDTIINIQQKHSFEYDKDNLDKLFYILRENDRENVQKICVVIYNIYQQNCQLVKDYLFKNSQACFLINQKQINILLKLRFLQHEYQPLLSLVYDLFPIIQVEVLELYEKLKNQASLSKLKIYDKLFKKLIEHELTSEQEYKRVLKLCSKNELLSADAKQFLKSIYKQ